MVVDATRAIEKSYEEYKSRLMWDERLDKVGKSGVVKVRGPGWWVGMN